MINVLTYEEFIYDSIAKRPGETPEEFKIRTYRGNAKDLQKLIDDKIKKTKNTK